MAEFEEAFYTTLGHEGGYSNDPDDYGKETYKGISRKYHPSWPGWELIDSYKDDPNFPMVLEDNSILNGFVEEFYKETFWDPMLGDYIPSQEIAEELFDTAVNMGISRAVMFLQKGLNVLNRAERFYKDIVVDGDMGPNTLSALEKLLSVSGEEKFLYKVMNVLQGHHYVQLMLGSESQERFARGWLKRVNFIKS